MYSLIHIYIRKFVGPKDLIDWSTNKVSICLFNVKFHFDKVADDKFLDFYFYNLANTIWWWQFRCKEEQTLDSMTKFAGDVNIKWIHKEEFAVKRVGSSIIVNQIRMQWYQFLSLHKNL